MSIPIRILLNVAAGAGLLALVAAPATAQKPQPPKITQNGVVNAADGSQALAPGAMVSIYGQNLARSSETTAPGVPLPFSLDGVSVEVKSIESGKTYSAPLYYTSYTQINFQMPFDVPPGTANVVVTVASGGTANTNVDVTPASPRLFTYPASNGSLSPFVLHATDFSFVNKPASVTPVKASPATPGEYLVLLATGLGTVSPAIAPGQPGGDNASLGPVNYVTGAVTVQIGGTVVRPVFAGLMPKFPGIYQINVRAPFSLQPGVVPISISMNGDTSQSNLQIAAENLDASKNTVLAQQDIGPNGGSLYGGPGGGLQLVIPSGAFDDTYRLRLSVAGNPPPFSQNNIAGFYRIDGLPRSAMPLRLYLYLQSTSPVPTGQVFLCLKAIGEPDGGPKLWPADVRNGSIVVDLPAGFPAPPTDAPASDRAPTGWLIWAMGGMTQVATASGNFTLHLQSGIPSGGAVAAITNALDRAHLRIANVGVDWAKGGPASKTDVYVFGYNLWRSVLASGGDNESPPDAPYAAAETDRWGAGSQGLSVNWDQTSALNSTGTENLRAAVGRVLFQVAEARYNPTATLPQSFAASPWLWTLEAMATWFERVVVDDAGWVPAAANANQDYLLDTPLATSPDTFDADTMRQHGEGAASLLQYLFPASPAAGSQTVSAWLNMMSQVDGTSGSPLYQPLEALGSLLGPNNLSSRWTAYVKALAMGSVYPNQGIALRSMLAYSQFVHGIAFDGNPLTFNWAAPDLSASLYQLHIDSSFQPKSSDSLSVKLTDTKGGARVNVFVRRNGSADYELLGSTGGELVLNNLAATLNNAAELVALVANGNVSLPKGDATTPLQLDVHLNP